MNKIIFITALLTSSCLTLTNQAMYVFDKSPCDESEDNYASLQFTFNTKFDNDLEPINVGHMINVPCSKVDTFTVSLEKTGLTGNVEEPIEDQTYHTFYNNANMATSPLKLEEVQGYFDDLFEESQKQPVVRIKVDLKLNEANITFFMVNNFMVKKLEEFGVPYVRGQSDYVLTNEMKEDLASRMEAKKSQNQGQIVFTQAQKEEFLKNLMKNNGNFVEGDSEGHKIHFKVVTRVVSAGVDPSNIEN